MRCCREQPGRGSLCVPAASGPAPRERTGQPCSGGCCSASKVAGGQAWEGRGDAEGGWEIGARQIITSQLRNRSRPSGEQRRAEPGRDGRGGGPMGSCPSTVAEIQHECRGRCCPAVPRTPSCMPVRYSTAGQLCTVGVVAHKDRMYRFELRRGKGGYGWVVDVQTSQPGFVGLMGLGYCLFPQLMCWALGTWYGSGGGGRRGGISHRIPSNASLPHAGVEDDARCTCTSRARSTRHRTGEDRTGTAHLQCVSYWYRLMYRTLLSGNARAMEWVNRAL